MDLSSINPILLIASLMVAATPILLAAIGELVAEKAGVLNLGVEGMMIMGAISGFAVAVETGSPWLGFLAAAFGGALMSLLFVILIGYYVAKIGWLLYPSAENISWSPPVISAGGNTARPSDQQTYQAIVDSHLFGTANAESTPVVAEETDDAPDTRLNLKLRATISADDQAIAHTIIADGSGKENVFFVRDSIPGGAT